jgi:hypothetical protein
MPAAPSGSGLAPVGPANIARLRSYLHATKDQRNMPLIHKEGLIAGASQGIGAPETGERFKEQVFVARPEAMRFIGTEAGGGQVPVISTHSPINDPNYARGTAGYFDTDRVPPVREATADAPGGPYSFTLPLTPRTRGGLHRVVQGLNPDREVVQEQATAMVEDRFRREYPLHFGLPAGFGKSPPSAAAAATTTATTTTTATASPPAATEPAAATTSSSSAEPTSPGVAPSTLPATAPGPFSASALPALPPRDRPLLGPAPAPPAAAGLAAGPPASTAAEEVGSEDEAGGAFPDDDDLFGFEM